MIGLGTLFCQFCFEVGRPGDQKTLKNHRFFSFFAISANLPTRGHMIDFLINLALNLGPKVHQKSSQEAPKIDKKGHRKYDASWLGIWSPLGTIFGGFWGQVGKQVGTKLAPKSIKNRSKNDVEKMSENCFQKSHASHAGACGSGRGGSLEALDWLIIGNHPSLLRGLRGPA